MPNYGGDVNEVPEHKVDVHGAHDPSIAEGTAILPKPGAADSAIRHYNPNLPPQAQAASQYTQARSSGPTAVRSNAKGRGSYPSAASQPQRSGSKSSKRRRVSSSSSQASAADSRSRAQQVPKPGSRKASSANVLLIKEQPAHYGRFRYQAEGRQNCLGGRVEGTSPSVQINPAYRNMVPDGTVINVDLVTRHNSPSGELVKHWHSLEGKDSSETVQKLVDGVARFDNLVVKRQKSAVRHKSEDQRVIRLHFTVEYIENGTKKLAEVTSQPVFSSELRIERMSLETGRVDETPTVFLLTSKVQRKSVGIKVVDPQPRPEDEKTSIVQNGWFLDEMRRPTYVVPNEKVETHHQFAVIITMPPFWTFDLSAPYSVEVRLVDNVDHTDSPPKIFEYTPNSIPPPPMASSSAHSHDMLRRTAEPHIQQSESQLHYAE